MKLNHKHLLVNGVSDVCKYLTVDEVTKILEQIVSIAGMKIMMGPYVERCETEGNEGITGAVVIETSHCSIHLWDTGDVRFDLYSCQDFDGRSVIEHLVKAVGVDSEDCYYLVVDRNKNKLFVKN